MSQDKGNITVRVPLETQKKLDDVASGLARSRNWLINEAIGNYLDIYEWQEQKIRERLNKAETGGKFRTNAQVNEVIESFKP